MSNKIITIFDAGNYRSKIRFRGTQIEDREVLNKWDSLEEHLAKIHAFMADHQECELDVDYDGEDQIITGWREAEPKELAKRDKFLNADRDKQLKDKETALVKARKLLKEAGEL